MKPNSMTLKFAFLKEKQLLYAVCAGFTLEFHHFDIHRLRSFNFWTIVTDRDLANVCETPPVVMTQVIDSRYRFEIYRTLFTPHSKFINLPLDWIEDWTFLWSRVYFLHVQKCFLASRDIIPKLQTSTFLLWIDEIKYGADN